MPQEEDSNVITVNLNIVNSLLLSHSLTSTQSHHILTVMQVVGAEKSDLCCSIFYPFLEEIKLFNVTQLPIKYHHLAFYFYNINDAKMLYSLYQHSLFTRKEFPYLQCICCREGSMDQKCQMITNNSYGKAYRRSEKHFNTTLKKIKIKNLKIEDDKTFLKIMSNHRDWCNSKNYRITHFGIKYDIFDILSVRNDILHLRLSVTRKIIGFIRHYLEPYDYKIKQRFISILKEE